MNLTKNLLILLLFTLIILVSNQQTMEWKQQFALSKSLHLKKAYDSSSLLPILFRHIPQSYFSDDIGLAPFLAKQTMEEAISRHVNQQIQILEDAYTSGAQIPKDELIRGQLWNLGESIQIMERLFPEGSEVPLSIPKQKAMEVLQRGMDILKKMTSMVEARLGNQTQTFDHEEMSLLQLADHEELIPHYSKAFEKLTGVPEWKAGKAKCGATARAILYYFYQQEIVTEDLRKAAHSPTRGMRPLLVQLKKNRSRKKGFLYFCESIRLDHVFIIQQTTSGKYRILQSFVNQYTLKANMAMQEFLTYDEVVDSLKNLEKVVTAQEWSDDVGSLYQRLFFSQPWKNIRDEFNQRKPDFSFMTISYEERHPAQEKLLTAGRI